MKKILILGVAMLMSIASFGSTVYASEKAATEGCSPDGNKMTAVKEQTGAITQQYVTASWITLKLSVNSGKASCTCKVKPKSGAVTSVKGTFRIINGSGHTVKTYSRSLTKTGGCFTFSQTYKLPARGTYHAKGTVTCYKNGVKKETMTVTSGKCSY